MGGGPKPNEPVCQILGQILAEFGLDPNDRAGVESLALTAERATLRVVGCRSLLVRMVPESRLLGINRVRPASEPSRRVPLSPALAAGGRQTSVEILSFPGADRKDVLPLAHQFSPWR